MLNDLRLSVLDLAPIRDRGTVAESFDNSVTLAQETERLGYHRFWLAEHHNIDGIASAATAVLVGHIAGKTQYMRVGSGGIMLPNHAPLVVAEQFGTLATLYPDRIDLGLGRAPGTDPLTLRALGRDPRAAEDFPTMVRELAGYLGDAEPGRRIRAVPGEGTRVPLWLLGSSDFSARLAAEMGLPFAFASHFAPGYIHEAIRLYRQNFRPSATLDQPYLMLGLPVIAAESDEEAQFLATTGYQKFLNLIRGRSTRALPPTEQLDWLPHERAQVMQALGASIVGGPQTVREGLEAFVRATGANELMINSDFYDLENRLRSYRIVKDVVAG